MEAFWIRTFVHLIILPPCYADNAPISCGYAHMLVPHTHVIAYFCYELYFRIKCHHICSSMLIFTCSGRIRRAQIHWTVADTNYPDTLDFHASSNTPDLEIFVEAFRQLYPNHSTVKWNLIKHWIMHGILWGTVV